ncbi:MAG: error-prone DNA polymerase [Alcanivoracaceae bacterium]|nr:error-prone DNA polymerase [Alcanivoracaceae bacterium]
MYAELHCTSSFTFLTGASQPEELVLQAHALGYQAIAITDECSFAGIVRALQAAKQCALPLIIGSRFRIDCDTATPINVILLAQDKTAYSEISALITRGRRRSDKGQYQLHWRDVEKIIRHALALWVPTHTDEDQQHGTFLAAHFPQRLWLCCALLQEDNDGARYHYLYELAENFRVPMIASNDVHMHHPNRQPLQDILTAIRLKSPVQQLGKQRFKNAQRHLRPIETLQSIYPQPLLDETLHIAGQCTFSLNELRYQYPQEVVPSGTNATQYLRALVEQGALTRWPNGTPENIVVLLNTELALINELQYEYYFLTVHDIVSYARSQNILCQGRGSAANSAVCYCLFITEIDPSRSQLLFERFISRERDEPPDIDVDFEHERREEVIQYIYQKYGRDRAALAATVIRYRMRSAVRDVGRALGLDESLLNVLAKQLAWWDKPDTLAQRFHEAGLNNQHIADLYIKLVMALLGFPRHLSQHVGGFVITRDPVHTLVPVENAAMADRTIIQWDKEDLESLGLMKVDVLALGMLTAIRKMLDEINRYEDSTLTMQGIPAKDAPTYAMLCKGDSLGVFQVESRAQMNMLPRLKPNNFYDLVIQVAIVRPGPIQGDMVHPYLRRRNGEEAVAYPDKRVEDVLSRTLGIPIFQEQVIQLVMVAAGFNGGQADQLRRAMASWGKSGELEKFQHPIVQGMVKNGYTLEWAERLFEMMKGFGGYGFPESHSASFALLVYVSAWMKRHHTSAFYCGLLNSLPMGFYSPSQLIQDARRHGIEVRPVDIHNSTWEYQLEDIERKALGVQPALRIGFRQIKGFNEDAARRIENARNNHAFVSLNDVYQRATLSPQERQVLVDADALRPITGHRHQAHWQDQGVQESRPLFDYEHTQQDNDNIALDAPSEMESMLSDYQRLSLTLGKHPMALVRYREEFKNCLTARDLKHARHGQLARVAGLVTNRQRPGTASGILFMTLEDETGNTNVIIWKSLQETFRQEILSGSLLLIKGTLEKSADGIIHLIAGHVSDHSNVINALTVKSRDFH